MGASMAGLCAARVLADRFDHVTVLDRDELPSGPSWRKQVPQGRHPHLLLAAGARLIEGWFPGISDELYAKGAVEVDLAADFHWHQGGGVARRPPSSLVGPSMSRPLLEWTVRQRLERSHQRHHPRHGLRRPDSTSIRAAPESPPSSSDSGESLPCDFVVDASGRQAHSVEWLAALGYPAPQVSRVEIDTRYVTQETAAQRPARCATGRQRPSSTRPRPGASRWRSPSRTTAGWSSSVGCTARWHRTPTTIGSATPRPSPTRSSPTSSRASEPLGDAVTHRFPASQRRHVERLKRFPLGWVLLGDAIGSFNPIYGQGMTSAAMQASALGDALDRSRRIDARLTRRYFKAAGRIVNARVVHRRRQRLRLRRHHRSEATRYRSHQPIHGQGDRRRPHTTTPSPFASTKSSP